MNTITHILLGFFIVKYFRKNKNIRIPKSFIIGSFAPDILFYLIVIFSYFYYLNFSNLNREEIFKHMFDYLYFNDPFWIFSYNILHSPLVIISSLLIVFFILKYKTKKINLNNIKKKSLKLTIILFFFFGCLFHSVLDIFVHHDDGPLLLYPITNEIRFYSPISYWDPKHFGIEFTIFETILMISLIFYLSKDVLIRKIKKFF